MKVFIWVLALVLLRMSFAASPKQRLVVVDISEQKVFCYQDGRLIKSSLVSTGYRRKAGPVRMRGSETPKGTFSVLEQHRIVYSKTFNGAAMPYAQRFFKQVWFHACSKRDVKNLGRKASHGCVRLSPTFSRWLFSWLKVGDTVRVRS